jgi:hypothetical protein
VSARSVGTFHPPFSFSETRYALSRVHNPAGRLALSEDFIYGHTPLVPLNLETFNEVVEVGKVILSDPDVANQPGLVDDFALMIEQGAGDLQINGTDILQVAAKLLSWNHRLAEYRRAQTS